MAIFLKLLEAQEKESALYDSCQALRNRCEDTRVFEAKPESFEIIPGAPFVYSITEDVRKKFQEVPKFESEGRSVKQGLATADDFRFVRTWWEEPGDGWNPIVKGGSFSPFYADVYLLVNWRRQGAELASFQGSVIRNPDFYFRAGITWPARPHKRGAFSHVPLGCVFSHTGTMMFLPSEQHWAYLALLNSDAYIGLLHLLMPRGGGGTGQTLKYEVGYVRSVPLPPANQLEGTRLSALASRAWSLKRNLDTVEETSHAFVLPATLRTRTGDYNPHTIEMELVQIQSEIDAIAYDLYGFSEDDRAAMQNGAGAGSEDDAKDDSDQSDHDSEDENCNAPIEDVAGLLSWAVGVAFGRYDWRLATAEREVPEEPEPFDPLPTKSPGMLPDDAESFHAHSGILGDDKGHTHDLAYLLEEVLQRVDAPVQVGTRRWLQRDFFKFHLKQYSKSRRKAPIYWPLSTISGGYTLWIYYPSLTDQTLFTAVNDFIEPKLKQVGQDVAALRTKGSARSRDDEKKYETFQALEPELIELRDILLAIAQSYRPKHEDGVQITAAPLWRLFRHKPWQKVLKDTWEKLEAGEYDWAHLAYSYWPDRVREKCKTDKSLAIAHGLEELYEEPAA